MFVQSLGGEIQHSEPMHQNVKICKCQGEGGTALVLNHVSAREGVCITNYV